MEGEKQRKEGKYVTVRIPKELSDAIDKYVGTLGFRSRTEFVKEAVRALLLKYRK